MMPAQSAISRFRRDLTLGSILNALLLGGVFFCVLLGGAFNSPGGDLLMLILLTVIWSTLGMMTRMPSSCRFSLNDEPHAPMTRILLSIR